jgi:hypothetical protein
MDVFLWPPEVSALAPKSLEALVLSVKALRIESLSKLDLVVNSLSQIQVRSGLIVIYF